MSKTNEVRRVQGVCPCCRSVCPVEAVEKWTQSQRTRKQLRKELKDKLGSLETKIKALVIQQSDQDDLFEMWE